MRTRIDLIVVLTLAFFHNVNTSFGFLYLPICKYYLDIIISFTSYKQLKVEKLNYVNNNINTSLVRYRPGISPSLEHRRSNNIMFNIPRKHQEMVDREAPYDVHGTTNSRNLHQSNDGNLDPMKIQSAPSNTYNKPIKVPSFGENRISHLIRLGKRKNADKNEPISSLQSLPNPSLIYYFV